MENYKDYIEKRVEIFPQQFKFGSFIRYEHCLEACKMAENEASKNFIKPDVRGQLLAFLKWLQTQDMNKALITLVDEYEKASNLP